MHDAGGYAAVLERKVVESPVAYVLMIEFHAAIFAWFLWSFGPPSSLWWLITWRGVGCRYMVLLR